MIKIFLVFAVILMIERQPAVVDGSGTHDCDGHGVIKQNLQTHVNTLALKIGIRNIYSPAWYSNLNATVSYIVQAYQQAGCQPTLLPFVAENNGESFTVYNIEVMIRGTEPVNKYYVIGAHYDSVVTGPGADDNGSGTAAILEMARYLCQPGVYITKNIKLVSFVNEEYYFDNYDAVTGAYYGYGEGSMVYAQQAKQRGDTVEGMISLETIAYYSNASNSQQPLPGCTLLLGTSCPTVGNFIGAFANYESREFLAQLQALYPSYYYPSMVAIAIPILLAPDIGRSDQLNFWMRGYPGVMISDTANFRNQNYHQPTDLPDTLDFDTFANTVAGLNAMIYRLAMPVLQEC